jgi:hypothetical protein
MVLVGLVENFSFLTFVCHHFLLSLIFNFFNLIIFIKKEMGLAGFHQMGGHWDTWEEGRGGGGGLVC